MVLLNAALLSKSNIYLARNYMPISKARNDALLSACSKLLDLQAQSYNSENSYIETDSVRYLYMPMGEIYLVLTTSLRSNILEDLAVLRMLQTIVLTYCPNQVTPEAIREKCFDLIFSFDECASFGHQESVTLEQIQQYIACDSHEEKLQTMIRSAKEQDQKMKTRQKALELDRKRMQEDKERRATEAAVVREERLSNAADQLRSSFNSLVRSMPQRSIEEHTVPTTTIDIDMFEEIPEKVTRAKGMKLGAKRSPNLL